MTTNQASSPAIGVPTVVVTVTETLPLALVSPASWALYNGGSTVSIDSSGNVTVSAPTDIRYLIHGADGTAYSPVGVSYQQAGTTDPNGTINFQTRGVANQVLTVHDNDQLGDTTYGYHIVFQDQNGQLHMTGSQ